MARYCAYGQIFGVYVGFKWGACGSYVGVVCLIGVRCITKLYTLGVYRGNRFQAYTVAKCVISQIRRAHQINSPPTNIVAKEVNMPISWQQSEGNTQTYIVAKSVETRPPNHPPKGTQKTPVQADGGKPYQASRSHTQSKS